MDADFHNILFISISVTMLAMAIVHNSLYIHNKAERCTYLVDATREVKLDGNANNKGTFVAFLKVNLFYNNIENALQKLIAQDLKTFKFTQHLLIILLLGITP